jgi:2,5-furandicarboxylate decarboxylase 1
MPYNDLREFMDVLAKRGELKVCHKEVDAKYEIAKVTDKSSKTGGPAILFKNVRGFKTPVVTGLYSTLERNFLAIDSTKYNGFRKLDHGIRNPIARKLVATGPCKEVIKTGNEVDLTQIPALWHHAKERFHYITATCLRVKDPDSGICNVSINRMAVQSKDTFTFHTNPPNHLRLIAGKYMARGQACPVSVSVGVEPAVFVCSGCGIPFGVDEFDFAGGVRGQAVETVKGETVDLDAPATAELVIEGEIRPGTEMGIIGKSNYASEGPFAEFTGHFGPQTRSTLVYVKAITHRRDYIYEGMGAAFPPDEHSANNAVNAEYGVFQAARNILPADDIVAIGPTVASGSFAQVVAIKKKFPGQGRALIYTILSRSSSKRVIVVDEDIDVFNPIEVEWATTYRAGAEDYIITQELPGPGIDSMVTMEPNLYKKVGIDATLPLLGDKKGRVEILRDLGPARYPDIEKVNLKDYIGE